MGETSRGFKVTYKGFTATVDVLYDPADTGQDAFSVGSSVTLNLFPEAQTVYGTPDSGDEKITGTAIVTGKTITSSYDGLVEASISLQGSGDLTFTTV
jgi:predicted secreted protein